MKRIAPFSLFFGLGVLIVLGFSLARPVAVTIEDEAYYLGYGHALAHGRLLPTLADPYPGAREGAPPNIKYPLGWPLMIAAALEGGRTWAMRLNSALAIFSAVVFAGLLKRRALSPTYAFLFLLQPALFFYSQTAMADTLGVLLLLLGLLQMEKENWLVAGFFLGLTGAVRIGSLIPGAVLGAWLISQGLARRRTAGEVLEFAIGFIAGAVWLLVSYKLTQGSILPQRYLAQPPFSWGSGRFISHLGFYLITLALVYPGMLYGLRYNTVPERWMVFALVIFQSGYFFVDSGRSWGESLILGQRLVLPAVAILLLGYAAWVDHAVRYQKLLKTLLGVLALGGALTIGYRYDRFEERLADTARVIDRALPPGAFLEYDPRVMKLAVILQQPGKYVGLFPSEVHREKNVRYYLAAKESLSYRATEPVTPTALPGQRLVVETPQAALYRLEPLPK